MELTEAHIALLIKIANGLRNSNRRKAHGEHEGRLFNELRANGYYDWWSLEQRRTLTDKGREAIEDWHARQALDG